MSRLGFGLLGGVLAAVAEEVGVSRARAGPQNFIEMISARGHLTSLIRHSRVAGSTREHLTNLIRLNYGPSNLLRGWPSGAGCNEGELRKQSKNEGCNEGELRKQSKNEGRTPRTKQKWRPSARANWPSTKKTNWSNSRTAWQNTKRRPTG